MSDTIEIEELRESIRQVLVDHRGDTWSIPDEQGRGLDRALWEQMAGLGWLALAIPENLGGLGLGMAHLAVLYEELGRELASVPVLPTMMVAQAIIDHNGAEHGGDAGLLGAIADGSTLAAIALPGSHGLLSRGADGTVSGTLRHVLFADVADLLAVPVDLGGSTGLALVPAGSAGVRITGRPLVDLTRSSADIAFERVCLADCTVLSLVDAAWASLEDHAGIGIASDAVGSAVAIFEMTLDYLKTREQFGRPIGSFQALKARMADWKAKAEAMTALSRHAAAQVKAGRGDASAAASGARAYAAQVGAALAGDAIQLHGGIGFTWEHPCHLFLKRAKLNEQLFGSPAYHKERVARLAFMDPEPASPGEPALLQQA
ncbi:acyl-CoA dehydrogenase family protein [Novosphingobium sp. BL-52-GroH]|uniref:acyl-CoA dehydrogenase family protein n=1 Tax=Novosphingobium sp. BL-52-GroH TaxID=3349877 RepID=UPI00384C0DCD